MVVPFDINNETPLTRMISQQTGTRIQAFVDAVRSRDRRCVITGRRVLTAQYDDWTGFEAAYIFPLAYEGLWKDFGYGRWIGSPPNGEKIKGGKINSVQNGLLLRTDIHQRFDMYLVSINPDVYVYTLPLCDIIANNYNRIITRLYALILMGKALLGLSSIKDPVMIHRDHPNSCYDGISGKLF